MFNLELPSIYSEIKNILLVTYFAAEDGWKENYNVLN